MDLSCILYRPDTFDSDRTLVSAGQKGLAVITEGYVISCNQRAVPGAYFDIDKLRITTCELGGYRHFEHLSYDRDLCSVGAVGAVLS